VNASRNALAMRYRMLPYIYSGFHKASLRGTPVARALFFEFPQDAVCRDIDSQFLLHSGLLITPVRGLSGRGGWV
jgi:alpha-glucosidase